jgi:hypothetical protein
MQRTTSRLQNDACRLTGAGDRANNPRRAAVTKGTVRITTGRYANRSKTYAFALLLFVAPAGMLSKLNTAKKEELHVAAEPGDGSAFAADVVTREHLAAPGFDLGACRLARLGSTIEPFALIVGPLVVGGPNRT